MWPIEDGDFDDVEYKEFTGGYYYVDIFGEFCYTGDHNLAMHNARSADEIYAEYRIFFAPDDGYLKYTDYVAKINEAAVLLFNTFLNGINNELSEEDDMIVTSATLVYALSEFDYGFILYAFA